MIAPFIDAAWLADHRDEVVVADVRWTPDGGSGRAAYDAGHVPGAVFVDLEAWLAAPASEAEGRHPLPDPATFAQGMAQVGVSDDDTVVAYDDAGGVFAARLVWMLRATGRRAALLDGGLGAYRGPLEREAVPRPPGRFAIRPWPPERLAGIDDAADPATVLIDARPRERFAGAADPLDPRPGHIPGARSVPCREHLDADGRLREPADLRRAFAAAGVDSGARVVSSCGSGVTACHNLLVLEHLGLGEGRLYPGSYSQWSRSDREVELGRDPWSARGQGARVMGSPPAWKISPAKSSTS